MCEKKIQQRKNIVIQEVGNRMKNMGILLTSELLCELRDLGFHSLAIKMLKLEADLDSIRFTPIFPIKL